MQIDEEQSKSEVNFRNNDNTRDDFKTYQNIFFSYISVLLPLHPFPVISKLIVFCVKKTKHNNPMVRNTIYLKMKTAPAKFHFGSDGSSSIQWPLNIKFKVFLFFERERSDRSKMAAVTPGINMRHLWSG